MRKKTVVIALIIVMALAGSAWIVGQRLKGIRLPNAPTPSSSTEGQLPVLADHMPEFDGIAAWLNSPPLKQADLRDKVVLVDFWTYSCINCIRTLPYTTAWYGKYKEKGFVVVGVHTPEFAFEKDVDNVRNELPRYGITYPVALDNDYATWNNYDNQYWPAEYLFDAQGRLRHTHFGEGEYDVTERDIQSLLAEAGRQAAMPTEPVVTPDFSKIGSSETYLGYARQEFLGSPEKVVHDAAQTYSAAATPELNKFYFTGSWIVKSEQAEPAEAAAGIVYRYLAANANLVMGATGQASVRVEVTLDGKPVPVEARGKDIQAAADGTTYVMVQEQRLYDLIDAKTYDEHVLQLKFGGTGVAAYAFTFG